MKHIKKFNEGINEGKMSVSDMIDQVLDNLNDKGELSKSEKLFMDEATKGTVSQITIPENDSDLSNPHNMGILWLGKSGFWKELKNLETEMDESDKSDNSDDKWEKNKNKDILKIGRKLPGIKNILNNYAVNMYNFQLQTLEYEKQMKKLINKLSSDEKYQLDIKIEYSIESLDSLFNQFGPLINSVVEDDDDLDIGFKINK